MWTSNKKWGKGVVITIMGAMGCQSLLMVVAPTRALYSADDTKYLVSGDISALGLREITRYLQQNDPTAKVGVSGIWGVTEGSLVTLSEGNIVAEPFEDFGGIAAFDYLYLTGESDFANLLGDPPWEVVLRFPRSSSSLSTYLIKVLESTTSANYRPR